MIGRTGLFRQQNEERRHTYSVRDWAALCAKDGLRAPAPRDIVQAELKARRSRRARKGEDTVEDDQERAELEKLVERTHENGRSVGPCKDEEEYYETFEPLEDWLPPGTQPGDYTPAVCRALERHFWRNCGLGKDPMYGADMQGSLFDPDMTTWNVSCLPNLLGRLLPPGSTVPGVNTPYLYFGESCVGSRLLIANLFLRNVARDVRMARRRHGSLLDQLHPLGCAQVLVCHPEHARRRFRTNDEE